MKYLYPQDIFAQHPLLEILPQGGDIKRLEGSLISLRARLEKLHVMCTTTAGESSSAGASIDESVSKHTQAERLMLQVLIEHIEQYVRQQKKGDE